MNATEQLAEANRLVRLQREHRGYIRAKTLEGKPCMQLGPYHATPETELRARQIITLRRAAALAES